MVRARKFDNILGWIGSGVVAILVGVSLNAQAAQAPARPAVPIGPRPNAGPPDRPPVDPVAADRGRTLYAAECVTCHGSSARGTATAPSLIRSGVVLNDRYGTTLGPFFQKGHTMQSGRSSAALTSAQVVDLMHFFRQRINDTLRGSDVFTVSDIVTGDANAGEAYFAGEGRCTTCHSATGDLAGLATRIPAPVDVQQRMLFPARRSGTPASPSRSEVKVTVTPASGAALTGVLIIEDDFYVTLRDSSGLVRVVRKSPGVKVVTADGLQAHRDLLDRITDKNIHDLVAYLVRLK
jgi:mono/diheme cytochrome c family protein